MWYPVERELSSAGRLLVAGVDEVGRGPLAGPVVACAIIMPPEVPLLEGVADSKCVKKSEHQKLATLIVRSCLAFGLGAASVREIDTLNIYHATTLAIKRALDRLSVRPDHIVIDGRPIKTLEYSHTAIVKGDSKCYSIACASIVAKVTRDRLMASLAKRYPGYLWERNAGYATKAHLEALNTVGVTAHHRRTFAPVHSLSDKCPSH